ncbi:MAG TPA: S53 family peptidase [Candidatus Dormibacteraeota bacterium]|nr:S53 family peptidase [Candidatus Dormibacteraeota bacterium]
MDRSDGSARALACALVAVVAIGAPVEGHGPARGAVPRPPFSLPLPGHALDRPPSTATCRRLFRLACYGPDQVRRAYGLPALLARGLDGRGRTIAVIDPYGSPTIEQDLSRFDRSLSLPDPPWIRVIAPSGLPPFDDADPGLVAWAEETSLDVEWAHVMAPGAALLVVAVPLSDADGLQGFSDIERAEEWVIRHDLADVIVESFGEAETALPTPAAMPSLREGLELARARRVTVVAAAGDTGSTQTLPDGSCCYRHPVVSWPASDPLVTSVGGTRLQLDDAGVREAPDAVWNDPGSVLGGDPRATAGAGGGGLSRLFPRPAFQDGVAGTVGDHRGVPDVSLSAALDGSVVVYWSFAGGWTEPGYHLLGGTSEAAPLFAGLVAIADQLAGTRLGWLNGRLYTLAARGPGSGIVDVTVGDNHQSFPDAEGRWVTVPGFRARPGYDLASGLGTVDAARLCLALARRPGRMEAGEAAAGAPRPPHSEAMASSSERFRV